MEPLSLLLTLLLIISLPTSLSQTQTQTRANASESCNGVFLQYTFTKGQQLPPNLTGSDTTHQPYRFESTLLVQNNGLQELKSWKAYVGFQHGELLVSASNAVLDDGSPLPANVSNGTIFAGFPAADLKTAVETAGDLSQMGVQVGLVGTQFGLKPPGVPMPSNISLANDGFICPNPTIQGNTSMYTCCTLDPNAKTAINATQYLPRQAGDLTIMYDIIASSYSNYWAQVTISNENPTGRLDEWQLSWDWMREEFIYSMKGASPSKVDVSDCIYGKQADFYKDLVSKALSCKPRPTIIDLPATLANDETVGSIPGCCKNGTLLPPTIDPSKSISVFQMQVYKMPPDLNVTILNPPQNWKINGKFTQEYECKNPVRVSPSFLPSSNGLPVQQEAISSWQVVCTATKTSPKPPKCCVSFSSFYSESVIPCRTCACGCPSLGHQQPQPACNATSPALLLPSYALLIPFENRTKIATAYAELNHIPISNLLPCGDNCGVTINWHLFTDYRDGWSSRITLFNWQETNISDWFMAAELDKAGSGLDRVYSFNGSTLPGDDRTILMHGFKSHNDYLLAEVNGTNPKKDPKRPGTLQSVILFDKKKTPGVNLANGDGFPTKVIFNGQECSLPSTLPTNLATIVSFGTGKYGLLLTFLVLIFLQH